MSLFQAHNSKEELIKTNRELNMQVEKSEIDLHETKSRLNEIILEKEQIEKNSANQTYQLYILYSQNELLQSENIQLNEFILNLQNENAELHSFILDLQELKTEDTKVTIKATQVEIKKEEVKATAELEVKTSRQSSYSESELEMLSKMINAEATGWPIEEKLAVGQVIINRKNYYNLTLKEAIFQKTSGGYVFSPLIDNRYYTVKMQDSSVQAAKRLLSGEIYKPVGNALYFCTHRSYNSKGWHWKYVNNQGGKIIYRSECHIFIH